MSNLIVKKYEIETESYELLPRRSNSAFPFAEMLPNQSFFIPADVVADQKKIASAIASHQKSHAMKRFSYRKTEKEINGVSVKGFRVWRTA